MPNLYFFRDIENIDELREKTAEAKKKQLTPISCNVVALETLDESGFNIFCQSLRKNQPILYKYIDIMNVDDRGWWNCIALADEHKQEKIVVYNNGFPYPRFTALSTEQLV